MARGSSLALARVVFAVLVVAAATGHFGQARLLTMAGWSFIAGILIFSGSVYALALTGTTTFGAITPIGGLGLLIGWACLAFSFTVRR